MADRLYQYHECEGFPAPSSVPSKPLFDCSVAHTQTFRSTPMVNETDDMIRVTLDMTRNEWHVMKEHIKQSNAGVTLCRASGNSGARDC